MYIDYLNKHELYNELKKLKDDETLTPYIQDMDVPIYDLIVRIQEKLDADNNGFITFQEMVDAFSDKDISNIKKEISSKNDKDKETKLRVMDNSNVIRDVEISDYSLTPMDKYAKQTYELKKSEYLVSLLLEGNDYISKNEKSEYVPKPVEIKESEESSTLVNENSSFPEEDDTGYHQVSIFDDDPSLD